MEITIQNLTKSFGDKNVLNGIQFQTQSGSAIGILGRNGAGKTTTIRIIMGVFAQDEGDILIDNQPIDRRKINIGYLPEERGMYPKKIIMEQLLFFGMLKNMSKKEAISSANYWLERLQMSEYKNKKLETLSKGNQQKIQLVASLISNPDIVILDEPFSGLDPVNAILLKDVVKELIASNKIVLFSSHQMNYIEEFCDDIVILNGGKIVLSGSIKEIKRSYDRSKIVIASKEADKIKKFLKEESTLNDNTILVKMESEKDKNRLLQKIVSGNFDIDEIKVYEPTLNQIFVEYTEGKLA